MFIGVYKQNSSKSTYDTRFLFRSRNLRETSAAQSYIDTFIEAAAEVGLMVNPSKSVIVYYGRQNMVVPITIDGVTVPVEQESLELGCVFSNKMNFKSQLQRNINKANAFVFTIRNTLKARSFHVLKTLYYTYYCPMVLYASQIWHSEHVYVKDALYALFRKFWRLGNGHITPGEGILDLNQLAIKHSLVFMFQMQRGDNCLSFDEFFTTKDGSRTRSEENNELAIHRNKYCHRDNFFTTTMAKRFNVLPSEIKNAKSVPVFKQGLNKYLRLTEPTPNFNYTPWFLRK